MTARSGSRLRAVAQALFGRPVRNERAYTLIEVTLTVWIMGAVIVTLIGSLLVMVKSADNTNRHALVDQELRRVSDAIRAMPYEPCADVTAATPGGAYSTAFNSSATLSGTQDLLFGVNYYLPSSTAAAPAWSGHTATWPYNANSTPQCNDPGAQRIAVVVFMKNPPLFTEAAVITKRSGSPCSSCGS